MPQSLCVCALCVSQSKFIRLDRGVHIGVERDKPRSLDATETIPSDFTQRTRARSFLEYFTSRKKSASSFTCRGSYPVVQRQARFWSARVTLCCRHTFVLQVKLLHLTNNGDTIDINLQRTGDVNLPCTFPSSCLRSSGERKAANGMAKSNHSRELV